MSLLTKAGVPAGMIVMWSGTIANIPVGWHLCDGTAGTPDLLDRFVQSVVNDATNPGATGGATAKTTSGHNHSNPKTSRPSGFENAAGNAVHTFPNSSHTHTIGNTGNSTDGITDIRPKYYALAFIMKT